MIYTTQEDTIHFFSIKNLNNVKALASILAIIKELI